MVNKNWFQFQDQEFKKLILSLMKLLELTKVMLPIKLKKILNIILMEVLESKCKYYSSFQNY